MRIDFTSTPQLRRARACLWAAAGLLAVASSLLLRAAGALPNVRDELPRSGRSSSAVAPALDFHRGASSEARIDLHPLLAKLAGRTLIRPAQVQAAVKSDGTAERLLKQLRLQGVATIGGRPVAYIQVEKEGVKAVREGDVILEFVVGRVEPRRVTLSLQGVTVTLGSG